jgi:hypothetical protein
LQAVTLMPTNLDLPKAHDMQLIGSHAISRPEFGASGFPNLAQMRSADVTRNVC